MTLEMITIRELLRDPEYREYFTKSPVIPPHYSPEVMPWKLFVLKEGEVKWRSKRFGTYREAFTGMKKMLPVITNAAINCPALSFMPPTKNFRIKGKTMKIGNRTVPMLRTRVWKPRIEADMAQHDWCPHCRRPTIFKVAAMSSRSASGYNIPLSDPVLRCSICGASERIIDLRDPTSHQKWDSNRPKVYL